MCGLVGIIGKTITDQHLKAFRWMLYLDVIRGEDSTGVAIRSNSNKYHKRDEPSVVRVAKSVGLPSTLSARYPDVMNSDGMILRPKESDLSMVMGHNRAATVGVVDSNNAHPFWSKHIIGCHNGTIRSGLHTLESENTVGGTDSEKIFNTLSAGKSLKEVFEGIAGAAALTWWDMEKKQFNFYRNGERTLYFAKSKLGNHLIYASRAWMIEAALQKAKIESQFETPELFKENELVTFSLDPTLKEVSKEEVTLRKDAVIARHSSGSYYRGPKQEGTPLHVDSTPPLTRLPTAGGKKLESNNNIVPFRSESGWLKVENLSKDDFDKLSRHGCSNCGTTLDYTDYALGEVKWLTKDTPLCDGCASDFSTEKTA